MKRLCFGLYRMIETNIFWRKSDKFQNHSFRETYVQMLDGIFSPCFCKILFSSSAVSKVG